MTPVNWICPHCESNTTITNSDCKTSESICDINNPAGFKMLTTDWIICPNVNCKQISLNASMYNVNIKFGQVTVEDLLQKWSLIPDSKSKVYPDYIPIALRNDYKEACLILDLSPKASATLSRRCVQGIIRDFWGISKSTLYDEISALEDQLDPLLWESINAVRSIGNIGAHMEKDINLIIDVDSKEAYFLIELIELLFKEWYILRYERKLKLESLVEIANKKKVAKNSKT